MSEPNRHDGWKYTVDCKKQVLSENDWEYETYDVPAKQTRLCFDHRDLAEKCAEYYHDNHDGWESSWPCDFRIYDADRNFVGCWEVDRESMPVFHAGRKKEQTK